MSGPTGILIGAGPRRGSRRTVVEALPLAVDEGAVRVARFETRRLGPWAELSSDAQVEVPSKVEDCSRSMAVGNSVGWRAVMGKHVRLLAVLALLVTACGGGDAAQQVASDDSATTVTSAPAATAPTTAAPATTSTTPPATTSTTQPSITFASLDPAQQELVDRICKAAADPDNPGLYVSETTILRVLSGESGVPALEEAWAEFGQDPDQWPARVEAAAPICADIGWVALEAAAPTSSQVQAAAAVTSRSATSP